MLHILLLFNGKEKELRTDRKKKKLKAFKNKCYLLNILIKIRICINFIVQNGKTILNMQTNGTSRSSNSCL